MSDLRLRQLGATLFALFSVQALVTATTMSVTCDESGHIGGGLYIWDYGKFDVYRVNPPLVRALACAPIALFQPKRDYKQYAEGAATRVEWKLGQDLIAANPDDWEWYFTFGRWAVMPLTLIGAWFVLRWSYELYGTNAGAADESRRMGTPARPLCEPSTPGKAKSEQAESPLTLTLSPEDGGEGTRAGKGEGAGEGKTENKKADGQECPSSNTRGVSVCGLVSLALYCFCPNVVAWSGTFTPDAAAAKGVAAGYSFWMWLREPTWRRAIEAGVWLGIAELTKFSWIILFPLWPLLWVMWRVTGGTRAEGRGARDKIGQEERPLGPLPRSRGRGPRGGKPMAVLDRGWRAGVVDHRQFVGVSACDVVLQ